MTTDTKTPPPRTDALDASHQQNILDDLSERAKGAGDKRHAQQAWLNLSGHYLQAMELARTLERELAEANEKVRKLEDHIKASLL